MANFEAFCKIISSIVKILFLKSAMTKITKINIFENNDFIPMHIVIFNGLTQAIK